MAESTDNSDRAMILILKAQGKTEGQAVCAINLLTQLGYGPVERARILTDRSNQVHRFCFFGSLWPVVFITLGILLMALSTLYKIFI